MRQGTHHSSAATTIFGAAAACSFVLFLVFAALWALEGHLLIWREWPWMPRWNALGFRTINFPQPEYGTGWVIPCWFLCAVTLALPLIWLGARVRWGRSEERAEHPQALG